jgi:Protein of unknown function DUF45
LRKRGAEERPAARTTGRSLRSRGPKGSVCVARGGGHSHFPNGPAVFRRMFTRLGGHGRPPQFLVEFYPYAGLTHTIRLVDERVHVRLSDLLRGEPLPVVEAAAAMLVSRLWRLEPPAQFLDTYREFSSHQRTRQRLRAVRRQRARSALRSTGSQQALRRLFDGLNRRYFGGKLLRPRLGWSRRPWRTQLGCFDRALNEIVLSARLNRRNVPQFVVEYVLFHEMLHVKHPVKAVRCGFETHSPSFRREERRFADYERARRFLAKM